MRSKVGDGGLVNRPEGLSDGGAAVLESVGRQLGLRVRFAGAEELGGADGMYDPRSREVVLSRELVGRGDDAVREGMMGVVAGHEVGHHLRVVSRGNAALWDAYKETVRDLMGAEAFEAEVDRVLDLYKRKFAEMRAADPERWGGLRDIDRDVAEEEVLVERGGRVMADSPEAMRRLIDRVAESGESAKGVVERMVAYLDELLAKLREGLGLSGRDAEAVEARLRAVREAWSGLYEYAAAKEREAVDADARFRVSEDEMGEVSERERRVSKAVTGLLEDAGIEVVADAAEMRRALGEGDAQMQARVSQLGKAASIIRSWIGNNMRDKKIEIELPKVVVSLIRRRLGRDFDSHTITANSVAHALKNHGIDGKKLTSNSIPLREDDLELIPYIMSAPDRVERGNPEGGRVSIKFVKELSNGYVVVVEKEYKNSPDDMETITMWADQSSNALNAAKGAPKHNVHNAIISTDDAAKIRKDAENAIAREINSEKMTEFLRTSRGDVYGFVKGGKVYIDPELLNPNTPIHEYTHLWDKALEKANRKLWERGKELMRGLPLWDEVKNDPAYADIAGDEDLLASEVHSRLSGKEGAKLLDDMVERAKSKGAMATAEAVTLKERVKAWLREALGWVRDAFTGKWGADDLSSLTVDEFGAMPVRDLCRGVNPNDVLRKAQQAERVMERNPMLDDYHYGIRGIGDVKTFEEALEGAEREYAEWGELAYPDLDIEGLRRAKETGEITVYSSKPIEDGGFVSTSRRAAKDYAGSGRVYEKKVKLTEVAWLDHEQGQMASDVDSAGDSGVRFRVVGDEPRRVVEERRGEDGGREFAVKRDPQWSAEGDAELVRRLEEGKKRKLYAAMVLKDGKLYPPMSSRIDGAMRNASVLGKWEESEERPDKIKGFKVDKDGRLVGKFTLSKANGTSLDAAYNPYFHQSDWPLNDQFSSAWKRGDLVVVEVEVPESELESGYRARYAKDAVGLADWKDGGLTKSMGGREVYLSRWRKPVRILTDGEVAELVAPRLKAHGKGVPFNVVAPGLRDALAARGVEIVEPERGNAGDASRDAWEKYKELSSTRKDGLEVAREMESAFEEKKGRIEKLRGSESVKISGKEIEITGDIKQDKKNALEYGKGLQGHYTNKDTGYTIQLQRGRKNGGVNEVLQHNYKDVEHLQSVAAIPQIIEESIYIDSEPNKDLGKNSNVAEYQHYVCGLQIGGEDYTVHSIIAVDKGGNRYYDHNLTHIEKGKLLDRIENGQAVEIDGFGTTPGTKPTTNIERKIGNLISLLQIDNAENAKKIKEATGCRVQMQMQN